MSDSICSFCGAAAPDPLGLGPFDAVACDACAVRIGELFRDQPAAMGALWPALAEPDDGEPEPRVRMPDGSMVELRERTAELKRGLTIEKRIELAEMLGELGLHREQLLEAAYILSAGADHPIAQRALDVLFGDGHPAPIVVASLRRHLLRS